MKKSERKEAANKLYSYLRKEVASGHHPTGHEMADFLDIDHLGRETAIHQLLSMLKEEGKLNWETKNNNKRTFSFPKDTVHTVSPISFEEMSMSELTDTLTQVTDEISIRQLSHKLPDLEISRKEWKETPCNVKRALMQISASIY